MGRQTLAIVASLVAVTTVVRADEPDDRLAIELTLVVRDPLMSVAVRTEAARTLGKLGPRGRVCIPELVRQIGRSRYPELSPLQEAMIDALGQIGGTAKPAIPALTREIGRSIDIDRAVARAIDQILLSSEEGDLATLLKQLRHRDESLRLRAVKAIGMIGPAAKVAVPNLAVALADDDPDVRRAALVALRSVQPGVRPGDAEASAIALDLQDPDPANRIRAVKALSGFPASPDIVLPAIQSALEDRDADVRRAANDALARLAPR